MSRAYSSMSVVDFLGKPDREILKDITFSQTYTGEEKMAWEGEIRVLKEALSDFRYGHLIFEYVIPRLNKRIDIVLLYSGIVFVLEFKVNNSKFERPDMEQCMDYALDLKNFHQQSHECLIVPMLIPTTAEPSATRNYDGTNHKIYHDRVCALICATKDSLGDIIKKIEKDHDAEQVIDPDIWRDSMYYPTPTIIEAAQELYREHTAMEIGSPEDSQKLKSLTDMLDDIIGRSKRQKQKSICFVTGIPGSGKTLAGLNLVSYKRKLENKDQTIFLSGNHALVQVLQRALILDHCKRTGTTVGDAKRRVQSFIQHMYSYREEARNTESPLAEKIVVFDEAQRAWTKDKLNKDGRKYGYPVEKSEPGILMDTLDRHGDWAVLVCLVGGGQEIHDGEIGMPGWFSAIRDDFSHWNVYLSDKIMGHQQMKSKRLDEHLEGLSYKTDNAMHLDKTLRSFRNPHVSKFVNYLMDEAESPDRELAKTLIGDFDRDYPIRITRNIETAKKWVRTMARGTERYGIIAHHNSHRLRPYGICIDPKLDVSKWFLDDSDSVYSSYYMEQIASEFKTQGLELDWTCVCWDANLRYDNGWKYNRFVGSKWNNVNDELKSMYLKNSYRVLLTRARQGMVIFVPEGDVADRTRNPKDYDGVYDYLRSMGIKEVDLSPLLAC